ncbi:hypothetical protein Patl1_19825 [Pistacia atlantica]|uniref:Uncharacterized protein n=1 Tax=Pistacia atlantica TaxID=434234 RepID=A0ACC1BLV5_9ROSI|nr:hypothetical protein Patl1_19825 [Pistacia atlantica]
MLVIGGSNCSSVIPFIATEITVIYREMFAGMYSSWVYLMAQVIIEIPYVFLQAVLFTAITYPAIKFLFTVTPTYQVATVSATFSYTMFKFILRKIPKRWIWSYWICPTAWSLKGILTSQCGNITEEIAVYGERKAINDLLENYYGYRYDDLLIVGIVLIVFPLTTAIAFAYAMAKLNFQKR